MYFGIMDRLRFVWGVGVLLIAGYMCMPVEQVDPGKSNFNCDETFNCTDESDPVCGSDGVTYQSKCYLTLEYQRRVCEVGNFNPIAFVHKGNCSETTEDYIARTGLNTTVY